MIGMFVGAAISAVITLVVAHIYFRKATRDLQELRDEIRSDVREVVKFLDWWRKEREPEMVEGEEGWEVRRPVSAVAGGPYEALRGVRSGDRERPEGTESRGGR